jgi:hypothetical protein
MRRYLLSPLTRYIIHSTGWPKERAVLWAWLVIFNAIALTIVGVVLGYVFIQASRITG